MNAVPNVLNEDAHVSAEPAPVLNIDTEPSNIISLSQQGLLLQEVTLPKPDSFAYLQYSPLNEW